MSGWANSFDGGEEQAHSSQPKKTTKKAKKSKQPDKEESVFGMAEDDDGPTCVDDCVYYGTSTVLVQR